MAQGATRYMQRNPRPPVRTTQLGFRAGGKRGANDPMFLRKNARLIHENWILDNENVVSLLLESVFHRPECSHPLKVPWPWPG